MVNELWAKIGRPAVQQIKSNSWMRSGLHKLLSSHIAVRKMADFPLELVFPASQHFNLFFSRKIRYEPNSMSYLSHYLKPGSTCFDVGANLGIYSIVAAHLVGPSGEVHAFEPDPQNWPWIERNAKQNQLQPIRIHKHAVGSHQTTTTLYQDTTTSRTSSLVEGVWSPDNETSQTIEVDVLPLDHYIKSITQLDLLKIDVETFEYEVVLGAQKLLQTFKPIVLLELSERHRDKTEALLQELGYTPQKNTGSEQSDEIMILFLHSSHEKGPKTTHTNSIQ